MQRHEVVELRKLARAKTGMNTAPQKLRQRFCCDMLSLGVSETHVDAFCERVHKSVLTLHYTDFSPEKLREACVKSGISVFEQIQLIYALENKLNF